MGLIIAYRRTILTALFAAFAALLAMPAFAMPQFAQTEPMTSDSGYFLIEWQSEGEVALELTDPRGTSRDIYSGANRAVFVSGLGEGDYTARLRDAAGNASEPLTLEVRHQSVSRALWLVALGALAFVATTIVILRGARDD